MYRLSCEIVWWKQTSNNFNHFAFGKQKPLSWNWLHRCWLYRSSPRNRFSCNSHQIWKKVHVMTATYRLR